jgi:dGTPase
VSGLYERYSEALTGVSKEDEADRSPVAKDRDRIIHSGALRRLQRKSQIVGVQSNDFFRTRLTHTFECAQIGRALAKRAVNTDVTELESIVADPSHLPDLIEAACLAHDLGHPPFGHNGEQALQARMKERAGRSFEGNAQSMRIVTRLEPKAFEHDERLGLDLCATTLRAIVKYPRTERNPLLSGGYQKFCFYDDEDERELIKWLYPESNVRTGVLADSPTLAARMLEAADDIAYAAHDFEDGVWAGMIPLWQLHAGVGDARGRLCRRLNRPDKTVTPQEVDKGLEKLLAPVKDEPWLQHPFDKSWESRALLKKFCATLIGALIEEVTPGSAFPVELPKETEDRIALLKAMAWEWMIADPSQETIRYGQRRLVEKLFEGFWSNPLMLPTRDQWTKLQDANLTQDLDRPVWPEKARLVCDHIAGMTDLYALHAYGEMFTGGGSPNLRLV